MSQQGLMSVMGRNKLAHTPTGPYTSWQIHQLADTPTGQYLSIGQYNNQLADIMTSGRYTISPCLVLFIDFVCSLSISGYPSTCYSCSSSIYISIPSPWSWFWLCIPIFQTLVLLRYSHWCSGNSSALSLRITTVRYVPSHYLYVYAIELRVTTVSVCHICLALPVLEYLCIWVASSQWCPHSNEAVNVYLSGIQAVCKLDSL